MKSLWLTDCIDPMMTSKSRGNDGTSVGSGGPLWVDCTYVINLDREHERLERMRRHLGELGIEFVRWPAVEGKLITDIDFSGAVDPRSSLSKSEIGCALSHMGTWVDALERGYERIAVFEDDSGTELSRSQLADMLRRAYAAIPNDFDVIYLGKCLDNCDQHLVSAVDTNVVQTFGPLCMHAYIIRSKAIRELLTHLPTSKPIDVLLRSLIREHRLKAWALHPSIFIQQIEHHPSSLRGSLASQWNVKDCRLDRKSVTGLWIAGLSVLFLLLFLGMAVVLMSKKRAK
jgi:GR25 family glycosyltransferase involved in LPS biosynthesis